MAVFVFDAPVGESYERPRSISEMCDEDMHYKVIVERGRERGYVAYVPALKGCVSQGDTHEVALRNVKEAAEAYVEALMQDNLPVPPEIEIDELELEVA